MHWALTFQDGFKHMEPNYFDLFSLPSSFLIDQAVLKKQFYRLSRDFHPDFHTHESASAQSEVTDTYAMINKAFKVLSDDFSRRQYILEMNGVLTGNDDKLPADFLMEMMELNEDIEALLISNSDGDRLRAYDVISAYEKALTTTLYDLEAASDNTSHSDTGLLEKIKECHLKTRYLLRIREKVANIAAF